MPSHFQATNPAYVGGRSRTFHIFLAPDPGSEPYLQSPRAWALLARDVTHRFRIVYRPCVNWSPCRTSGPGLGLGLLLGRFLCPVVSEPHAKPVTRASTEPKANLWLGGRFLPSFPWPHAASFLWRGPLRRRICSSNLLRITQGQVHFISYLMFLCIVFLSSHVSPPMVQN